jgi:hypothetical protein
MLIFTNFPYFQSSQVHVSNFLFEVPYISYSCHYFLDFASNWDLYAILWRHVEYSYITKVYFNRSLNMSSDILNLH